MSYPSPSHHVTVLRASDRSNGSKRQDGNRHDICEYECTRADTLGPQVPPHGGQAAHPALPRRHRGPARGGWWGHQGVCHLWWIGPQHLGLSQVGRRAEEKDGGTFDGWRGRLLKGEGERRGVHLSCHDSVNQICSLPASRVMDIAVPQHWTKSNGDIIQSRRSSNLAEAQSSRPSIARGKPSSPRSKRRQLPS